MRIAFFTQWWPPEPANIVGSLGGELGRRGHHVDVVTGFPNYPTGHVYPGHRMRIRAIERAGNVCTIRVPLYPSHDRSPIGRAANYLSYATAASTLGLAAICDRPDVAYVYHPPITSAWAARMQRVLRGVPFILHIQDLWPESVVESRMLRSSTGRMLAERALSRACTSTYHAAAHLIVLSPGFKRLLVERGVAPEKISVVMNWADEAVFGETPVNSAARAQLGPLSSRIILYAGNLGDYQNLDAAVLAMVELGADVDVHLTFIGDGLAKLRLESLAAEHRLTNVSFLPRRPASEMAPLLTAADLHLVSLADLPFFAATIPGKLQVAMAMGKCVIVSVRGDAAALTKAAGAGFTCEPTRAGLAAVFRAAAQLGPDDLAARGAAGRRYYDRELSLASACSRIECILDAHRTRSAAM